MHSSLHALLVSYTFPPTGGAGVHRVLKLAKYLPSHDVTPAVLTVRNPSLPLRDDSLIRDVDPAMTVLRAKTFEPGYKVKAQTWRTNSEQKRSLRARVVHGLTS